MLYNYNTFSFYIKCYLLKRNRQYILIFHPLEVVSRDSETQLHGVKIIIFVIFVYRYI